MIHDSPDPSLIKIKLCACLIFGIFKTILMFFLNAKTFKARRVKANSPFFYMQICKFNHYKCLDIFPKLLELCQITVVPT